MKSFVYLVLLVFISSCLGDNEYYVKRTDLVHITEVSIPDSAMVEDTVEITATAQENNGCWRDLNFSFQKVSDTIYALAAYGTFESYGTCASVIVNQDTVIDFIPLYKGVYLFHVARNAYVSEVDTMIVE